DLIKREEINDLFGAASDAFNEEVPELTPSKVGKSGWSNWVKGIFELNKGSDIEMRDAYNPEEIEKANEVLAKRRDIYEQVTTEASKLVKQMDELELADAFADLKIGRASCRERE